MKKFIFLLLVLVTLLFSLTASAEENAYIIVHAVNPEGVEIASIQGMSQNSVEIYGNNTLWGHGAWNAETHNKPSTLSFPAGTYTIKVVFNGMIKEQTLTFNPGETKVVTFVFARTEFNLASWIDGMGMKGEVIYQDKIWVNAAHQNICRYQSFFPNGEEYVEKYEGLLFIQNDFFAYDSGWYTVDEKAAIDFDSSHISIYLKRLVTPNLGSPWGGVGFVSSGYGNEDFEYPLNSFSSDFNQWYVQAVNDGHYPSINVKEGQTTYTIISFNAGVITNSLPANKNYITTQLYDANSYILPWVSEIRTLTGTLTDLSMSSVPYDLTGTGVKCEAVKPPVASFMHSPQNPKINEKINFDASSSSDPDGTIVEYEWDFGDGNTAEGMQVTHSYANPGDYTVTLTVIDNDGLHDSLSRIITVNTCYDGIRNGDETGIDCGGSCPPCVSCNNRIMDGDETGIDCGGSCPNDCVQLKILAVPLKWEGSQSQFDNIVDTQINFFIDAIPLKSCPETIKLEKLDVNKYNFNDFTCNKNDCGVGQIKPFIESKGINVKDYDHIIGFIQDSPCYPIVGCSNGKDAAWVLTTYDVVAAHEIGHFYDLEDEYCSNQAGSKHPNCNDGHEWWMFGFIPWPPTDINYLDSNLGCDPHIGNCCSNCSKGNNPFDPDDDYFVCCEGNINSKGGRAIMSYADAPGPRDFDDHSKNHLTTFTKLNCPSLLKSLEAVVPGKIIDLNLKIFKNDSVKEEYIHLVDGTGNTYISEEGNYNLLINDINSNTLFNYSISHYFDYDGPAIKGTDYSSIDYTSFELSLKIPYDNDMHVLYLIHDNITIFSKIFDFCNQDGICNGSETYLSCWYDCKSYSKDGLCLNYIGDGCDPDCAEGVDVDCKENSITLSEGWNLISLPLKPEDMSVTSVLSPIQGRYDQVWAYQNGLWLVYVPSRPLFLNSLTNIDESMGLYVKATENAILTITGVTPSSTLINLKKGTNLIGYPSLTERNITEITHDINDSLDSVFAYYAADTGNEWKSYSPIRPPFLNTLTTMKPGYGYWVKVNQNTSLVVS